MKLGVFDSGIGGEAIADALRIEFPFATIDTVNDRAHIPYGNKSQERVLELTQTAIRPFLDASYDAIILACNTATAAAIEPLRLRYPSQKFIGIEPMIKTAADLTTSGTIAVCATPSTLESTRYKKLVQKHASHLTILEPDCSTWAYLIENNQLNKSHIELTVTSLCEQGADVIVLGCTHYHWIKTLISDIANGGAQTIEPSEAIGRRVRSLLNL